MLNFRWLAGKTAVSHWCGVGGKERPSRSTFSISRRLAGDTAVSRWHSVGRVTAVSHHTLNFPAAGRKNGRIPLAGMNGCKIMHLFCSNLIKNMLKSKT